MVTSEALDGVPILVLANKQDVEVSLSSQRPHSVGRESVGPFTGGWGQGACPGHPKLHVSRVRRALPRCAGPSLRRRVSVAYLAAPGLAAGAVGTPCAGRDPILTPRVGASSDFGLSAGQCLLQGCLGRGRVLCGAGDPAPHCSPFPQTCLSIPDIKTAFSDCSSKIGRRDCLTQACSALTG